MTDVIVAVPARDEEQDLPICLEHVLGAAGVARSTGVVRRITVAVAAHRCSDRTLEVASRILSGQRLVSVLVAEDRTSESVGSVRAALLTRLVDRPDAVDDPHTTWLFTTDADSYVPADWLAATLAQLHRRAAVASAGMVQLRDWTASAEAKARYAQIIREELHGDGHGHVYAANLAVRLDAYLSVGGFHSVPHGEEHDLLDRLRRAGYPVTSLFTPLVSTSGRHPGRASHGLGDLLDELARSELPQPSELPAH